MKRWFYIILVAFSITTVIQPAMPQQAVAADCGIALREIFSNEGGFQKLRNDSGNWTGGKVGKGRLVGTKYGICAASYPKVDIPNLTLPLAARYYERDYWGPLRLSKFKSQGFATTMLDTAVNCGTGTAGVLFGRMRNIVTGREVTDPVDPEITAEDVRWFNDFSRVRSARVMCYFVFQSLRSERYVAIAKRDRTKRQFLTTWLLRTWE